MARLRRKSFQRWRAWASGVPEFQNSGLDI
jgi:hypothetical protein